MCKSRRDKLGSSITVASVHWNQGREGAARETCLANPSCKTKISTEGEERGHQAGPPHALTHSLRGSPLVMLMKEIRRKASEPSAMSGHDIFTDMGRKTGIVSGFRSKVTDIASLMKEGK